MSFSHMSDEPKTHLDPWWFQLFGILDADYFPQGATAVRQQAKTLQLDRLLPFIFLHVGCLGVLWTGWSPTAVIVAIALYWLRMFAVTAFYHRYFSHKTFKTSRILQCVFALWGLTAVQKGPLWWAAHHRVHHAVSDQAGDLHSPNQRGFWWSQLGWIATDANIPTDYSRVPDLARYPELVFLNRMDWIGALMLALTLYGTGSALSQWMPEFKTSGLQLLIWGFFISTTVLFHATSTINSLSHLFGSRRYKTPDHSRNNWLLAIITMGEGWHNNHHQFPGSVRQGFFWWEIDLTYYVLRLMAFLGLIYDLKPVPVSAYQPSLYSSSGYLSAGKQTSS